MNGRMIRKSVLLGTAAAVAFFAFTACEVTATFAWDSINPSGRVVNAYTQDTTSAGVDGVTLTLEYISGAPEDEISPGDTFSGTSGIDGTYVISNDVPYGTYVLTGTKDDFAFIDQRIDLTPDNKELPDLIGVPYENAADVSIVALWKSSYGNVDAYVTFPDTFSGKDFYDEAVLDNPNDTFATGVDPGFFANDGPADRERLSEADNDYGSDATFGNLGISGDASTSAVGIERYTDQGPGPETVAIRAVPIDWFGNVSFNTSSNDQNLLPTGNTYAWVGVLQYYVYGASGNLSVEGESAVKSGADLSVYVTQGPNILGRYRAPDFTNVEGASLIRINLLAANDGTDQFDFYQIVPDTQLVPEESDGTFNPSSAATASGVINTAGRARR